METATLIFPHQLFRNHLAMAKGSKIILVEEWLFFNQYHFHKQKLLLHRASMKCYELYLLAAGFAVTYIEATVPESDIRKLIPLLAAEGIRELRFAELADDWLSRRLGQACSIAGISQVVFRTPAFLNNPEDVADFFNKKKTYFQTDFYIWQRKHRHILLEGKDQPLGGKWSFDDQNRERFPKKELPPVIDFPVENAQVKEARDYVERIWPDNYGSVAEFTYPVNFEDAEAWLQQFLERRLEKFGVYEDAMVAGQNILFHSCLTPLLNTGLLEPQYIIDRTLEYASANPIPINSLEGFVRQIMGWREFVRIVYHREGRKQRTRNYWDFTRRIPECFWKGETGIVPVDVVIKKTLANAYNHHIERLMVLGNFMVLCEFDPDEVYRWFMEMYIDAYDWVMVPNVYGMTQFADGGLMTTKPYISGSNYLMKMGDWPKGEWQATWDGLFWRFMHVHRAFFQKNPRLGMLLKTFDQMPEAKRNTHLANAASFLEKLDTAAKR